MHTSSSHYSAHQQQSLQCTPEAVTTAHTYLQQSLYRTPAAVTTVHTCSSHYSAHQQQSLQCTPAAVTTVHTCSSHYSAHLQQSLQCTPAAVTTVYTCSSHDSATVITVTTAVTNDSAQPQQSPQSLQPAVRSLTSHQVDIRVYSKCSFRPGNEGRGVGAGCWGREVELGS